MHTTNNVNDRLVNNNPFMPDVPFHPDLLLRPPKQPIKQNMTYEQKSQNVHDINPNISFGFEETFQRPGKSFFQDPRELGDLINKGTLFTNICQNRWT